MTKGFERPLGRAIASLVLSAAVLGASPAFASPITIGDPLWYEFSWYGSPVARGCAPADPIALTCEPSSAGNSQSAAAPAWTFTALTSAVFTITDAYVAIERFEVFDFGTSIGLTSAIVPSFTNNCSSDPVVCLADGRFSHGVFSLSPGAHSITIAQLLPSVGGAAYFRVTAVPEPSTMLMVGAGLLAIARRRRRG